MVRSLLIPSMYLYLIFNTQVLCNLENMFIKLCFVTVTRATLPYILLKFCLQHMHQNSLLSRKALCCEIPKYFIKESLNPYQKCIYKIPPHSMHHTTNTNNPSQRKFYTVPLWDFQKYVVLLQHYLFRQCF